MTKVQLTFRLRQPLDRLAAADQLMTRIAGAHTTYGIFRIWVDDRMEDLSVEYDATRLSPQDVQAVLARAGIPLVK
ncbi:MAG: hypothetical protein HYR60_02965 [Acidobacteria bacterium]|nr:hypothetical protein [Acidobacteriota bacterium]MBI3474021.1 hypothetical protein [Candidatus Solibacter usitatus]